MMITYEYAFISQLDFSPSLQGHGTLWCVGRISKRRRRRRRRRRGRRRRGGGGGGERQE